MKLSLIGVFFIAFCLSCFSQSTQTGTQEDRVLVVVEQSPEFPGGTGELFKYLNRNLIYPESARIRGIEGTVHVSFVVGTTGEIRNVEIVRGVDTDLDLEAIRAIKKMFPWKPGKQAGKPVAVKFQLPIKFRQTNGPVLKRRDEVDSLPAYPGGENNLWKDLKKNIQIPKGKKKEGYVVVEFVIDTAGESKDHSIFLGLSPEYDQEAIRAITDLQRWKPGSKDGLAKDTRYRLTVVF